MNVRSVGVTALAIVVITSMLTIWFWPSIQEYMGNNPFWNGLSDFTGEMDVSSTESLSEATDDPENTILVEISYAEYSENDLDRIEEFVLGGGALILTDDYGYGNRVAEKLELAVRFSGQPLLDPLFCHKNQKLPRVTDFDSELTEAGIEAIVLNHGTALLNVESQQVLARSSAESYIDEDEDETHDEDEPKRAYAVASAVPVGSGTVILLADPSIFINSMDIDGNRAFMAYLMETYGPDREITMDTSRLPKAPLDQGKVELERVRERITHPYSVAAILGGVVLVVFRPWQKKEAI
ncbi:MAG: DUF4350 domain-containing protein [Chloroflexi bacterium]|nr:DUF4350 domain-containing protein [Chloroflexota bacterium]